MRGYEARTELVTLALVLDGLYVIKASLFGGRYVHRGRNDSRGSRDGDRYADEDAREDQHGTVRYPVHARRTPAWSPRGSRVSRSSSPAGPRRTDGDRTLGKSRRDPEQG